MVVPINQPLQQHRLAMESDKKKEATDACHFRLVILRQEQSMVKSSKQTLIFIYIIKKNAPK